MELPNRYELEAAFARRVARLGSRHKARLRELLGKPPDPNNVPESFWREVEEETQRELVAILYLLFINSGFFHAAGDVTGDGLDDATRMAITASAQHYSDQRSAEVARGFADTSRSRFDTLRSEIERSLDRTGKTITRTELDDALNRTFGPDRAESVAVTETTQAQSAGGETGARFTFGIQEGDWWKTEDDDRVCSICRPLHQQPRSVWSRQFPDGPPAHTNCRCVIVYASVFQNTGGAT